MGMGKNSRSPLVQMVGTPDTYKQPDQPPTMTIKKAGNGGFIVSMRGKEGYSSEKEHVYESLDKVTECMEKHFGKGEKAESGDKKGDA